MARLGAKTTGQGHLVWSEGMSARGVEFLENWIAENISRDSKLANARALAESCIIEAPKLGISPYDMESDWVSVEQNIRHAIEHLAEPGTPGD